jgi:hypothetical protein
VLTVEGQQNHEIHDHYLALSETYRVPDFSAEGDFSERLLTLSQHLVEKYKARYGNQQARRLSVRAISGQA